MIKGNQCGDTVSMWKRSMKLHNPMTQQDVKTINQGIVNHAGFIPEKRLDASTALSSQFFSGASVPVPYLDLRSALSGPCSSCTRCWYNAGSRSRSSRNTESFTDARTELITTAHQNCCRVQSSQPVFWHNQLTKG